MRVLAPLNSAQPLHTFALLVEERQQSGRYYLNEITGTQFKAHLSANIILIKRIISSLILLRLWALSSSFFTFFFFWNDFVFTLVMKIGISTILNTQVHQRLSSSLHLQSVESGLAQSSCCSVVSFQQNISVVHHLISHWSLTLSQDLESSMFSNWSLKKSNTNNWTVSFGMSQDVLVVSIGPGVL